MHNYQKKHSNSKKKNYFLNYFKVPAGNEDDLGNFF